MKLHELKIKEAYYKEVLARSKTFEIRKNDRDFQQGDLIHFNVIDEKPNSAIDVYRYSYSYPFHVFRITYVLKDVPEYGLNKDYCILGIKELVEKR